ncbi:hypothetical protein PENSPDRAFT_655938 [Peniophora sp. CONT]|nr:hypothetical protein PENSPDRAFT_655938 [Peniophora sp. CONT]
MSASKRRTTGHTGLDMAVQITSMSATISQLVPIPALSIATSTILAIIDIVAEVKANKAECTRLAWRSSRMLIELARHMEGKWATAPPALASNIREFEQTLSVIHEFMSSASDASWLKRLMGKSTIEDNILDMNLRLDAAAQSFQIASLIEIHHALGGLAILRSTTEPIPGQEKMPLPDPAAPTSFTVVQRMEDDHIPLSQEPTDEHFRQDVEVADFLGDIADISKDKHGFNIYHQAEVRIGRAHRRGVGWFSETADAQVNGQRLTVKRYGSSKQDMHQWVRDVKILRQLFHANIPQLVGYSDGQASVPFVLLSNGPTKDVGSYAQSLLKNESLAKCAVSFLDVYRDILSAATHVQQQLTLTDDALQDFVEGATYTVDSNNNVLMGLAPPKDGWHTFRSYNLCESLVDRALKYLKNLSDLEQSKAAGSIARTASVGRTRQLLALLKALLPSPADAPQLPAELEDMLEDGEPELADLRQLALASGRHGHTWCERCPTGTAALGDYGVLIDHEKGFESFQTLGNVFADESDAILESIKEVDGELLRWGASVGPPDREQAKPYLLPGELEEWPIVLMPQGRATVFTRRQERLMCVNDAWNYFLKHAPTLADRHGVPTYSLLLITRTLSINDFQVFDRSPPPLPRPGMPNAMVHHHVPHAAHFGSRTAPGFGSPFGSPMAAPNLVYLFTSGRQDIVPYLTDDPMGRPRPQSTRSTSWCFSCSSGWPVDYVDYIQLDKEDCVQ